MNYDWELQIVGLSNAVSGLTGGFTGPPMQPPHLLPLHACPQLHQGPYAMRQAP
jgi:hypothetical protein